MDYDKAIELYEPVLGFEVHVELNTKTKMFSDAPNFFGGEPNTNITPVDLGLPGSLPVVNEQAVKYSISLGLALGCSIAASSRFARKNYFYPDLAKNYQISQFDEPIAYEGLVEVELPGGRVFEVPIERAHMEEDAGKLTHVGGATGRIQGAEYSLVDYNRAGVPLVEIVTHMIVGAERDAPELGKAYVSAIRDIVVSLGISDAKMERGNLRCDANVSLRSRRSVAEAIEAGLPLPLGLRTETKNVNSLRSVERAIRYEIQRQAAILESGGSITQETRHWHEDTGTTSAGRPKSDADDLPLLSGARPAARRAFALAHRRVACRPAGEASRSPQAPAGGVGLHRPRIPGCSSTRALLVEIEETVAEGAAPAQARKWWTGEIARIANERGVDASLPRRRPGRLGAHRARRIGRPDRPSRAAGAARHDRRRGLTHPRGRGPRTEGRLGRTRRCSPAIDSALASQPDVLEKIREGKVQAAGAVIGAVMKALGGSADAARVRELVLERASSVVE
ncbi:MAG: Asp-tRNA(Asn)/Glu-tRNA(Gln) amidotransferase subunit GatB, partial [Galbitalea sp.]